MTRCIVPECTPGYNSNNEKVHFFCVPQDEKIRNMWQAAIRRCDFIKSSQAVCKKHFLKTDIVWQAAGSNDHPGTPTFLQLYKILSTFTVLKSPSYGNCFVKKYEPLITITDIKHLCQKSNNVKLLLKLKDKLDYVIDQDHQNHWIFEDLQNEDFCQPEITDCIIYHTTGYLCHHFLKRIRCDICKNAFFNPKDSEAYNSFSANKYKRGIICILKCRTVRFSKIFRKVIL